MILPRPRSSSVSYATRVHDDGTQDILTGSQGQDWFLFNVDADNTLARDKVTGLSAQEFANDIDFINGP